MLLCERVLLLLQYVIYLSWAAEVEKHVQCFLSVAVARLFSPLPLRMVAEMVPQNVRNVAQKIAHLIFIRALQLLYISHINH